jgi:Glyoxalase/Bleomycin resistance protein/Dioxygenase superfamily
MMHTLSSHIPLDCATTSMVQLGYVFRDISGPLEHYRRVMGATRFLRMNDAALLDQRYYGRALQCRLNIAFGFIGSLNVEFVEPLEGLSCYSTFLDRNPGGGLHHIGCRVTDFDRSVADLTQAGFELVQSGRFGAGTRFAYFDTLAQLGHYLEVIFFDPEVEALFDAIREGRIPAGSQNSATAGR